MDPLQEVKEKLEEYGQSHLLRFVFSEKLNQEEKDNLLQEISSIDLSLMADLFKKMKEHQKDPKVTLADYKPWTEYTDVDESPELWGGAAVLLMAGGQGTRLGSSKPKGCYEVGLFSGFSLYELHGHRLNKIRTLAGGEDVHIPWIIMTSKYTHDATVKFFKERNYCGYPKEDVYFFSQDLLPCVDHDGKIILSSGHSISMAPNGNGGVFKGLVDSGILESVLLKNHIQYCQVIGVDNLLVRVGDPAFYGFCVKNKLDVGNKVCLKRHPHERVGVMCYCQNFPAIVEYSNISKDMAEMEDKKTGQLQYGLANLAMHCFSVGLLNSWCSQDGGLPYHTAHKTIPYWDEEKNKTVNPEKPNGLKFEMFIFDVFHAAKHVGALKIRRKDEFSPVKNAAKFYTEEDELKNSKNVAGTPYGSSPITAKRDLATLHQKFITRAGGTILGLREGALHSMCEIHPDLTYGGEGLEELVKGKGFYLPLFLKK